jgi:hypothetical protein
MSTVQQMINSSLKLLGVIGSNETPQASESQDALETLNNMLELWSNDPLLATYNLEETFPTVIDQSDYTIGSGGDFNTTRPLQILEAYILDGTVKYEFEIYSLKDWIRFTDTSSKTRPTTLYYTDEFPLGKIKLWSIPDQVYNLTIYSKKQFTSFTNLTNTISLPPGYKYAIKYNLAVELAPEYKSGLDNVIVSKAEESKSMIRKNNAPRPPFAEHTYLFSHKNNYLWSDKRCF